MLCHEYFPNSNLQMSEELRQGIVRYYDFLVAYENLLRGGGEEVVCDIASGNKGVSINAWPPQQGKVTAYCRKAATGQIIHLLNYRQANSLSWRDMDGTMPAPQEVTGLPLSVKITSAGGGGGDALAGAPLELSFAQKNGVVTFTLPSLKYWSMIVIES